LNFKEWEAKLEVDSYILPSADALIEDSLNKLENIVGKKWRDKAIAAMMTGPTEYAEYSCSQGQNSKMKSLGQVAHSFDFALLTRLNFKKADKIHFNFFKQIIEVYKALAEDSRVDILRIADDFCSYKGAIYNPAFTKKILDRQLKIGKAIQQKGKFAVLHADGDISAYLKKLGAGFDGLHPLDLSPKSTISAALEWTEKLTEVRKTLPKTTFLTGMPIDLICNRDVSVKNFINVIKNVINCVGDKYLILTSTHSPYPGWYYKDFKDKVRAVQRLTQELRSKISF